MKCIVMAFCLLAAIGARADLTNDVQSWTNGPFVAFVGDSITAGYPWYRPASDGGPSGNTNANLSAQLLILTGGLVQSTNFGVQGKRWVPSGSYGLAYNVTNALKTRPRYLFVRCGVNDITAGNTWDQVLEQVNLVRLICGNSNALMVVQDVLPRTSGDASFALTIRTWNSNFTAWASTSGVRRVADHDIFGTNRPATGFPDDLATAFDYDGLHLKTNAYPFWGSVVLSNLIDWSSSAVVVRAGSATIHRITIR